MIAQTFTALLLLMGLSLAPLQNTGAAI
jgi:hypothetical protein